MGTRRAFAQRSQSGEFVPSLFGEKAKKRRFLRNEFYKTARLRNEADAPDRAALEKRSQNRDETMGGRGLK